MNQADLIPTSASRAFWAIAAHPPDWIQEYWNTIDAPYRHALIDALIELPPFGTLLEVGCHCGPNLALIHRALPRVCLHGMDVNERAIVEGRERLRAIDVPASLRVGAIPEDTDGWPDGRFDVVLSCYTLAHVGPDDLVKTMAECWRLTAQHLVIFEPMALPPDFQREQRSDPQDGFVEWQHDYVGAANAIPACAGTTGDLTAFKFPAERRQEHGTCIDMDVRLNGLLVIHRC